MISVRDIVARSKAAWKREAQWYDQLRDIYAYALPQRNLYEMVSVGERKGVEVYDSTAIISTMRFANWMQDGLTPPFQRWANLVPGAAIDDKMREELQPSLNTNTKRLNAAFSVGSFYTAINEFYLDLASGTGVMLVMEGDDQTLVDFVTIPAAQVALDEDERGKIGGVFRKFDLTLDQIEKTWPDASISDEMRRAHDEKMGKKEGEPPLFTCMEACVRDRKAEPRNAPRDKRGKVIRPGGWRYVVVWSKNDPGRQHQAGKAPIGSDSDEAMVERLTRECPFVVSRWMKVAGEVRGRGPLNAALPTILTLNKTVELLLGNAALAVSGIYTSDDEMLNPDTVELVPGAIIPKERGAEGLKPLEVSRNFDVSQLVIENLQTQIRQILMDEGLPPASGAVRSATEIIERMQQLQRTIGPAYGRQLDELITPLVRRVLEILENKGALERMPAVDGLLAKVDVQSPIAKAQAISDIQSFTNFMQIAVSFFGPKLTQLVVDAENGLPRLAQMMGVPQELLRTQEQRMDLMQQVSQIISEAPNTPGAGEALQAAEAVAA